MPPWFYLMRLEKPIGSWLLLSASLHGLWLAQGGLPPLRLLIVFILGTFIMRSAGCIINDIADRGIDSKVARTRHRPLASGQMRTHSALLWFIGLSCLGFMLALMLGHAAIKAAILAMPIIAFYPYSKRFIPCPQVVLSIAFAWPVIMAYMAIKGHMTTNGWILFATHAVWIIGYDTLYAMADKADDLQAGIQSMATWLGKYDAWGVWCCFILCAMGHFTLGYRMTMPLSWYITMVLLWSAFIPKWFTIHQTRKPQLAFEGFQLNALLGLGSWLIWAFFLIKH